MRLLLALFIVSCGTGCGNRETLKYFRVGDALPGEAVEVLKSPDLVLGYRVLSQFETELGDSVFDMFQGYPIAQESLPLSETAISAAQALLFEPVLLPYAIADCLWSPELVLSFQTGTEEVTVLIDLPCLGSEVWYEGENYPGPYGKNWLSFAQSLFPEDARIQKMQQPK